MKKKPRIIIGLSGGVDSSVAAYLCKEAGYDVVGLFMNNWEESNGGDCSSANDWEDARAVAAKLDIPCYSVNFAEEYYDRVFKYFLAEYKAGRTPNPDVLCNREIKFGPFLEEAKRLGAELVATGHYAGKSMLSSQCSMLNDGQGSYALLKAVDDTKDQTYFLNQLRQDQLKYAHFPLADIKKEEVRRIAEKLGFVTAKKKDSTGICFIGERKFKKFLAEFLPAQPGLIVDTAGKEIGRHDGLMYYTLGQRRGLNIGGRVGYEAARWYVVDKDMKANRLIVSCGEGEELLGQGVICSGFNWIGEQNRRKKEDEKFNCTCKFRYRQEEQSVCVEILPNGKVKIIANELQRALTPGQYAVLYDSKYCLGGGVIEEIIK
ncbi:MAG: tRNA 2-thiouridine(34) synthase MnmA [Firmicutes bacterium]|nr:tRNA 2-thiouridine(34) synthase MnmA [Bacillota bacterium]